ncbi:hypothetical protein DRW03_25625 [Corallococcus sp. H22C18031201]|uniref:hypothetical protein n=1 Tax=Citreicoccus inhibens TaxID=2849499 RepID=UPI000E74E94A|nr:hypothetical protein [Citreicoccus inhibens]MBU8898918.1 hypothetical protein [Citreicoccus inhibens]RJS18499.1 hypothetical protein DRW03_25625 [Corallococcus sp. H22C18031201]
MFRPVTVTVLISLASLLGGCSNNADTICDRRKECVNDRTNTGACANDISAWQKDNKDREARAAECADCVSSRSCAEIFSHCIDDCLGIP